MTKIIEKVQANIDANKESRKITIVENDDDDEEAKIEELLKI